MKKPHREAGCDHKPPFRLSLANQEVSKFFAVLLCLQTRGLSLPCMSKTHWGSLPTSSPPPNTTIVTILPCSRWKPTTWTVMQSVSGSGVVRRFGSLTETDQNTPNTSLEIESGLCVSKWGGVCISGLYWFRHVKAKLGTRLPGWSDLPECTSTYKHVHHGHQFTCSSATEYWYT